MDAQGLQQLLEDNREKIIDAVDHAELARQYERIQQRGLECLGMYDRIFQAFLTLTSCVGGCDFGDSTRTPNITLEEGDFVDFGKGFVMAQVVGVNPSYQEIAFKYARGFAVEYFFVEDVTGENRATVLLGNETFQAFDRSDNGIADDSLILEPSREWTESGVINAEAKLEVMKTLAYQTLSLLTDRANDRDLNPFFNGDIGKEYLEPLCPSA